MAAQTFASKVVARFDPHARVQVEAVALDRERRPYRGAPQALSRVVIVGPREFVQLAGSGSAQDLATLIGLPRD